jgi:hypothetical protein
MTGARIVLVKPGDVLLIGNVGKIECDDWPAATGHLETIKAAFGLAGLVVFAGDIDLAAVTPGGLVGPEPAGNQSQSATKPPGG